MRSRTPVYQLQYFLLMVCVLGSLLPPCQAQSSTADSVAWYGELDTGVRSFRFFIHPSPDPAGAAWQLLSLDEGAVELTLDSFRNDGSTLAFELKKTNASYLGNLNAARDEATGQWKQNGASLNLKLRQVNERPVDKPAEVWTGELTVLFQKLPLQFRLYRDAEGNELLRMDSLAQKAGGFLAVRNVTDNRWSLQVPQISGKFEGELSADGKSVSGQWTQGGPQLDLTLTRSELAPSPRPANRPQTPKPPLPYEVSEVGFESLDAGVRLAGTLTIPRTAAPAAGFPAAILISGSGPQDRDETLFEHRPFAVIADALTRSGVAVLRFDDRGTGQSTGNFAAADSRNFKQDVLGALRFLQGHSRLNSRAIGLIGHSEGGLIGTLTSAGSKDVAFLVLLAGTGVSGADILLSQGELIARAEGITDEKLLRDQRRQQEVLIRTVLQHPADATVETLRTTALQELAEQMPAEPDDRKAFEAQLDGGLKTLHAVWFRFFLTYNPADDLKRVTCPVLALNGARDTQVDPRLNLPAIRSSLAAGGNQRVSVEELPGLNHLFQTCRTGGVSEYEQIEETISPLVLQRLTEWISSTVCGGMSR